MSYQCDAVLSRLAAGDTSVAIAVQPFERIDATQAHALARHVDRVGVDDAGRAG